MVQKDKNYKLTIALLPERQHIFNGAAVLPFTLAIANLGKFKIRLYLDTLNLHVIAKLINEY